MSRAFGLAAAILFAGCANAGSGGLDGSVTKPDGSPRADAATQIDARSSGCVTSNECVTATMLGSISGDTGHMTLTAMGQQPAWFRVRVTEDNNNFLGVALRVGANLTSPAVVDFDVFVYLNAAVDIVDCVTAVGTTTTTGNLNETRAEWGEGALANGQEDGRDVTIEVRAVSGMCVPTQTWQLEVEGNWL